MNIYLSNEATRKLTINELNTSRALATKEINLNDTFCKMHNNSKVNNVTVFRNVHVNFETSYCEVQQDTVCVITIA
ncbi:MAG: hypothetical protein EBY40_11575 [Marivivens sp.]|nr:hypothetical protein [Marivivens sp.]